MTATASQRIWIIIWTLTITGFALRIVCAQGGLWLDEAWSAKLAAEAKTPIGVFLNINHDNNHHLNSLWMQIWGMGAAPWLLRLASIATSTLTIPVAAMIARRHGRMAMVITALLFAFAPILVTMGSEARGYAPMTLAFCTAILLVDRWLAGERDYRPHRALALCVGLGMVSQLTMVFGIVALVGWAFFAFWNRDGIASAIRQSIALFWPAMLTMVVVIAVMAIAALASPTGFQFGRYESFDLLLYLHGIVEMLGYCYGILWVSHWLIAITLILLVIAPYAGAARIGFYRLSIFAFPFALAVLQAGNSQHPRYFLVAGIGLLLMVGDMIATGLERGGWQRWIAAVGLGVLLIGATVLNLDLVRNQRGAPDKAILAMREHSPDGAVVALDRSTGLTMLEAAAAHARYPVRITTRACPPPRFIFADRFKGETFPDQMVRCGRRYAPVASMQAHGMSGTHWTLYELRR